mgnify:CR=1 FL=1
MKQLYLITGAKGHLASTIIRCLRGRDCLIRGLILPSESGEDDAQLTYYHADVTKPETLDAFFSDTEGCEVTVIHTAAIISIAERVTKQLYRVNVAGTRNILTQCLRHKVKRLVYVSSVHAIPESCRSATVSEVSSFSKQAVVGAYASTKAEASQAVLDAVKQGLDAVIVHPSGIIGPYDDGRNHIVQLIQMYLSGKLPAGVTGGYDFVDVRDVAEGCLLAADKGTAGSCYILSNRYFTVRELLECARRVAGGRRLPCLPVGLAKAFVPLFEWVAKLRHARPLFTKYSLYTISNNVHFSHDKATVELGYTPRDMQATVRDTILWLQGKDVPLA